MTFFDGGHLGPEALIDLVEGCSSPAPLAHLERCESCRRALAELRAVYERVSEAPAPEPSPLFWEHFSARVHDAVADVEPAASRPWRSWRVMVPVAAVAGLLMAVIFGRGGAPAPTPAPVQSASERGAAQVTVDSNQPDAARVADDEISLRLMEALVAGLDHEALESAGLGAADGVLDGALVDLSSEEQVELVRLLRDALAGTGA